MMNVMILKVVVMTTFLMVMMMMNMAKKWRVAGGGLEWVGWGWRRESRGGKLSVNNPHCTPLHHQLYHLVNNSQQPNAHCTAPPTVPSS